MWNPRAAKTSKQAIAILLFVSLAISLTPLSANSAQKIVPGSSCKNENSQKTFANKKYTCIKKNEKLVWNKGVPVKSAAPKVTPTPTPSQTTTPIPTPTSTATPTPIPSVTNANFAPWSTNIDSKSLSDQAQRNFLSWVKSREGVATRHTQVIQTNANASRISIMKKADDLGAKLFSSYFPQGSTTVIGATESWTVEQLNKNGWNVSKCSDPYMSGVFLCLEPDRRQGYVVTSDATYNAAHPGADGGALLAHEYFHLVQFNLAKTAPGLPIKYPEDPNSPRFPVWFSEGTADFVGFSVGALAQNATYWEGRSTMFTYSPPEESVNRNAISDYEIRSCCGNNTPTYPYHIGRVATEYIVASIGFQKMLDIFTDYATTKNFEKSFENVTGISKTVFYEKFEQIRTKVGLPAVSWKLDGLTNKKIGG